MSAKFESKGRPGAIGKDSTGGPSYGAYQIATHTGTMQKFLTSLKTTDPAMAKALAEAGGAKAAKEGSLEFNAAWKKLASEQPQKFFDAQHRFIKDTHYEPQAAALKSTFGIDVEKRSKAVRDVVWSMAVQHGSATTKIVKNALDGRDAAKLKDTELIRAFYAERSKVEKYFSSSTPEVRTSVKRRFEQEEADALRMAKAGA